MWVDCTDLPWVVCGSAILEKTRSLTTIADGGLFVKKADLAHIFSYVTAYQSSVGQTRKSVTSRAGREISSWDIDDAGSLRTSGGNVAHFSAPPRDEDQTDSPTGLISLVCKS